jgi:hypothetical protein
MHLLFGKRIAAFRIRDIQNLLLETGGVIQDSVNRPPNLTTVIGNALYWFSGPARHPHDYASREEDTVYKLSLEASAN